MKLRLKRNLLVLNILLSFVLASYSNAEASSNQYFEALGGAMNVGCSMNFSLKGCDKNGREVFSSKGKLQIFGECYKAVAGDEMEITCNGTTKSIIRQDTKEIIISGNDRNSRDLLENPLQIIKNTDNQYIVSIEKGNCVKLQSKDKHSLYPQIKVWFKSGANASCKWIPVKFELIGKDKSVYTIEITQFTSPVKFDKAVFNVDAGKRAGYETVDLR